jgi:hypothetical protein
MIAEEKRMAETLTLSLPEDLSAALRKQAQVRGAGVSEVAVRLLAEAMRATRAAPLSAAELGKIVANLAARLTAASNEASEWLRQVLVAEAEDTLRTLWRHRPVEQGSWAQILAVLLDVLRLNPAQNLGPAHLRALSSVAAQLASVELDEAAVPAALDVLEAAGLTTFPDIPDADWEASAEPDEV